MSSPIANPARSIFSLPVLVAALGYLVDMYDLFLFSIVRVPSLKSLGFTDEQVLTEGVFLLNLQMAGMLLGGIFWGVLGDKKGRRSVLFGSILVYSLANLCNGLVSSLPAYAIARFVAGFGLAGELGLGITLVVEALPKTIRGYGTTLVATMGLLGALMAYGVVQVFSWRASYIIGGCLGLVLMTLRFRVFESGMFIALKDTNVKRGDILMLFNNRERLLRYITSIVIGMPIWFITGIVITFSPEIGRAMGLHTVDAGKAVMLCFSSQVLGNIVCGFLSQYWQSRKRVILFCMIGSLVFSSVLLQVTIPGIQVFYIICACLGFFCGYWTIFITVAAELFGSNLRATVATTVPNFVRATVIPLSGIFIYLKGSVGTLNGTFITGLLTYAVGFVALAYLDETFKRDMNFTE